MTEKHRTFEEFALDSQRIMTDYSNAVRKVTIQECLKIAADLANEEASCSERRQAAWRIVTALQLKLNEGP